MKTMVVPTEVKMTPDGQVYWHAHDIDGGTLYTPTELPIDDDPLQLIRAYQNQPSQYEMINRGGEGSVRSVGGYALKHYLDPALFFGHNIYTHANDPEYFSEVDDIDMFGGLPSLRANVGLTEGLKMTEGTVVGENEVRGVEIYAAYMPHDPDSEETLWLMEKIEPAAETYIRRNDWRVLHNLYRTAFANVGIQDYEVDPDDGTDSNVITARLPDENSLGELVKIDSFAIPGWLNF